MAPTDDPSPAELERSAESAAVRRALLGNAVGWAVFLPGSWTHLGTARTLPLFVAALGVCGVFAAQTRNVIAAPRLPRRARRAAVTSMLFAGLLPVWAMLVWPLLHR